MVTYLKPGKVPNHGRPGDMPQVAGKPLLPTAVDGSIGSQEEREPGACAGP